MQIGVRLKLPVKSDENPKRQSTAALQNLSDSRASPKLREVLECGCALPLWIEIPHHAKTVQPSPCECATKLNRTLEELIPTCHLRSATANLYYAWRRHSKRDDGDRPQFRGQLFHERTA